MRPQKLPRYLQPMLATRVDDPFNDPAWIFETKWDGFRIIAEIKGDTVTLYSRNGQKVTESYRMVADALGAIKHDCVIDGELVALDAHGRSRFQLLQRALKIKAHLRYCVFDIMFLDGRDLRKLPLVERKEKLRAILPHHPLIQYSAHRKEFGKKYFKEAKGAHEEGIMAKRAASPYLSGRRAMEWQKFKTSAEQEAIIVGFTAPRNSRKHFGSLVLAVYDGKKLAYAGHVGTGFDLHALREIHAKLLTLRTHKKPFVDKIKFERQTTWVKPQMVAEIQFTEWTKDGEMRHPSFVGLRSDKRAREVVRE